MNGPHQVEAAPNTATTGPPSNEEIYCPICNYNLTGITTGRCPECGSFFDREALLSNQKANRITLIPWDDPVNEKLWPSFAKTLRICLFDSKRFAFAFSVQPQQTRASSFLFLTILLLWLGLCFVLIGSLALESIFTSTSWERFYAGDLITIAMATVVSTAAAVLTTTYTSAAILGMFCLHFDNKRHFRPWLAIASYSAAHFLLIPLGLPLFVIAIIAGRGPLIPAVVGVVLALWLATGLLNAFTLNGVIRYRGAKSGTRPLAVLLIFVTGFFLPLFIQVLALSGAALVRTLIITY